MKRVVLSKSKYIAGLSCPKLLWCHFNAPEKIPAFDDGVQAILDQGNEVGSLAKKLYPKGVDIGIKEHPSVTKNLLSKRVPLFEASFATDKTYCKVDILVPVKKDEWDIVEVKSSTEVKDEHVEDVAFQQFCLEQNGLNIHRVHVMVVNSEYEYKGKFDVKKFFTLNDVSEEVLAKFEEVEENIASMLRLIAGKCPSPKLGVECKEPKSCPVCSIELEDANIPNLYYMGAKAWPLLNQGVRKVEQLPRDFKLTPKQQLQVETLKTGKMHLDKNSLSLFLKKLQYPITCLDFETISPAIPLFDKTRPYQTVPFQFSAHVISESEIKHVSFLAEGPEDPRKQVTKELLKLPRTGTVLAYNMSFEKRVLHELADVHSEHKDALHGIVGRMDDLIIPFKEFWVHHPKQNGSCSIKEVLPALTGESYDGLEICQGGQASNAFLQLIKGKITGKEVEKTRKALLEYCGKDTEGMVKILETLTKLSKEKPLMMKATVQK